MLSGPRVKFPPQTYTPSSRAASAMPRASKTTQSAPEASCGLSIDSDTRQYLGTPRIAARSENDTISARYPISSGGASAGKCTSGSSVSMEAICAKFGVVEITAASSPGPKATQSPAARSPSPRVMASINANSLRIGVSGSCSPRLRCCAHLGQDDPAHR